MSKNSGGYMGVQVGKLGPAVGSMWKGRNIFRAYNPFVKNPRTEKQQLQRARFSVIAKALTRRYDNRDYDRDLFGDGAFIGPHCVLARERQHLTAGQAARLATLAEPKQLMLTHISARYKEPELLTDQATAHFPNTLLATDGQIVEIK